MKIIAKRPKTCQMPVNMATSAGMRLSCHPFGTEEKLLGRVSRKLWQCRRLGQGTSFENLKVVLFYDYLTLFPFYMVCEVRHN